MAYGLKYTTTYCDVYGVQCQVRIFEDDYIGASTELEAQTTPFLLTYEATSDFKFEPIRPSSASINLVLGNGLEFDEIWTADERKYKIEHYINNILDWTGFVVPNGYSHNFTGGLYYATLEATDGLGLLEGVVFRDSNTGLPYGNTDLTYNDDFEFPFVLIRVHKYLYSTYCCSVTGVYLWHSYHASAL